MAENKTNPKGNITFADEVVATIAGLAAVGIAGVAGMSGGLVGGIAEFLGKKNFAKGVKVEVSNGEVVVNLQIISEYKVEIPLVSESIQDNVKNDIEKMTGLKVKAVNVHVQGIIVNKEEGIEKSEKAE